jgi:hypothetical protein
MLHKFLIGGFVILFPITQTYSLISTQLLENLPTQEVDSNYVNLEQNIFSIRTFLNFKSQSFKLSNKDHGLRYIPNNRFGVGVGIAYYPILLDVSINIKVFKEDASERLDFQGELLYKRNLFSLYIQDYKGFNITGDQISIKEFRPDIKSFTTGLSYLRILNPNKMSFSSVFTGGAMQKKSVGSFALGGSASIHRMSADSSIVPSSQREYFNDYALITEMLGINVSIKGGYSQVFVLPDGFFVFASLFPGIGISIKEITSIETYIPGDWLNLELDFQVSFGYNGSRIYSTIGVVSHHSNTSLDYSIRMISRLGRIKWVVGFKL